jgi:hypothetical protein
MIRAFLALPRFSMNSLNTAAWAEFSKLQPRRVIATILLRAVVPLAAFSAFERNRKPVSFRFLGHDITSLATL